MNGESGRYYRLQAHEVQLVQALRALKEPTRRLVTHFVLTESQQPSTAEELKRPKGCKMQRVGRPRRRTMDV